MKRSLIWLLTGVMAITFGALLYFQIMYLENMVKMREEQFSEGVMRSLFATSEFMDRQETLHFLEQDVNLIGAGFFDEANSTQDSGALGYSVSPADSLNRANLFVMDQKTGGNMLEFPPVTSSVGARYGDMQEVIRSQYLYQKGLLTDVILSILRDAGSRPVIERADSAMVRNCLSTELANNGVRIPFAFSLNSANGDRQIYASEGYNPDDDSIYSINLFSNTGAPYTLNVEFPTKHNYIFSSVRFIIPSLAFTLILLVIFLYTVIMAFRQKKLTEMKTDFVNNMTHELKTPIATISLASQMLSDASVRKSPESLSHLAEVISEESKRLRFQVEKVLHLSVIDNAESSLKFTDVNANEIIETVVNTFKLKVERQGGTLIADLGAIDSDIYVDQLQFTNVIHNLLENALKYSRDDVEPELAVSTADDGGHLTIRVSDNGIGIHRDDIKHIFDKFYRVSTGNRHDVKGFGLGLAYVKKMITAFHGTITVESEPGEGSTFIITLPLSSAGSH